MRPGSSVEVNRNKMKRAPPSPKQRASGPDGSSSSNAQWTARSGPGPPPPCRKQAHRKQAARSQGSDGKGSDAALPGLSPKSRGRDTPPSGCPPTTEQARTTQRQSLLEVQPHKQWLFQSPPLSAQVLKSSVPCQIRASTARIKASVWSRRSSSCTAAIAKQDSAARDDPRCASAALGAGSAAYSCHRQAGRFRSTTS